MSTAAIVIAFGVLLHAATPCAAAQPPKRSQTAAQKKIDSHLLRAIEQARTGVAPSSNAVLRIDAKGRALVELRADVTDSIKKQLLDVHATTLSVLPQYRSILAWVPLAAIEALAARDDIYAIQPAPQGTTNKPKEQGR